MNQKDLETMKEVIEQKIGRDSKTVLKDNCITHSVPLTGSHLYDVFVIKLENGKIFFTMNLYEIQLDSLYKSHDFKSFISEPMTFNPMFIIKEMAKFIEECIGKKGCRGVADGDSTLS